MIKFLDSIKKEIIDSISTKDLILGNNALIKQIQLLIDSCLFSLSNGGKIILAGNGGSFADAQHLSAEFTSRFMFDRNPLPSIALGTNSSAMSAIGNDYGYDRVFDRQVEALANTGDVAIGISTGGIGQGISINIRGRKNNLCCCFFIGNNICTSNSSIVIPCNATDSARIIIGT